MIDFAMRYPAESALTDGASGDGAPLMKLLLERVKQAGASSERVAGVIIILAFVILTALFAARTPVQSNSAVVAVNVPVQQCAASTIFSASFTHGQTASPGSSATNG